MLDPTPSLLLNGILFSTWTGEGVTVWKHFQHRKIFFKIKYNYLVKVIDPVVALHKAIWLSAIAFFFCGSHRYSVTAAMEACTIPLKEQE